MFAPLNLPAFRLEFTEVEIYAISRDVESILRSGRLTLGPYTERFERAFAEAIGTKQAVAVNSGTSALEVIFRAIEVRERSVLVPTNTNFATAVAAVNAGARIRLYDGGMCASADEIGKRIEPSTRVVVVVHIGGYISEEIEAIARLCSERGVLLVEDAAHAHGALRGGRAAGTFGVAAAFSFVHSKVLTTGEGGMIVTDDDTIANLGRSYRNQGYASDGKTHARWGNSWRLTEVGAAIGLAQLPTLNADCSRRHQVICRYQEGLADVPVLAFPTLSKESRASGYKCIARTRSRVQRQQLEIRLRDLGIQLARGVYEFPLHQHALLAATLPDEAQGFPLADAFAEDHLCLPLWRSIPQSSVEDAIERIRSVAATL